MTDSYTSLVAIHGLNGDPMGTWTHQIGQPMWLRDILPQALPNVRILTYGYDASFRNFTAEQDIRKSSINLLSELADLRTEQAVRHPRVSNVSFLCCD